jgi:hypothetical protein
MSPTDLKIPSEGFRRNTNTVLIDTPRIIDFRERISRDL